MTPARFRKIVKALYGKRGWAEKMGEDKSIGVCARTVYRWATGKSPIKPPLAERLEQRYKALKMDFIG